MKIPRSLPWVPPALVVAACFLPSSSTAQTPEQRYADWASPIFAPEEYAQRRARMLEALAADGGGVFIVPSGDGSPGGGTFRQSDDFWYFTGLEVPYAVLVLDADAGSEALYLPPRDRRFENPGRANDFPGRPLADDPELRSLAGVDQGGTTEDFLRHLSGWVAQGRTLRMNPGGAGAAVAAAVPFWGTFSPEQSAVNSLLERHPGASLTSAYDALARVRMIKSPAEVAVMRRAADATMAAIRATAAAVTPGVSERTLQGVFEAACRAHGAQAIPFTPIVKSGPNSLWPWRILAAHYDRRNRDMEAGELVILDVGCEVDGYVSDVGRTLPVSGRFTAGQADILRISTRAADAIIAAARPGVTLAELTRVAYDAIPDSQEGYMQTPSFFGHHIGLSTGDPALMDAPLEPGMVFTVEPWYYNHQREIAVFVEDVILITEEGAELLTSALPRDRRGLEELVSN